MLFKNLQKVAIFLNCYRGFCNTKTCNYKCTGFSFIGNHLNNYMDLIIEIKEGVVQYIYQCLEFMNETSQPMKKSQIRINKLDLNILKNYLITSLFTHQLPFPPLIALLFFPTRKYVFRDRVNSEIPPGCAMTTYSHQLENR